MQLSECEDIEIFIKKDIINGSKNLTRVDDAECLIDENKGKYFYDNDNKIFHYIYAKRGSKAGMIYN